jgi:hypothetical protein
MHVSEAGEELMVLLVAWEMLGRADLDPHQILREVDLEDLEAVHLNISIDPKTRCFVCCEMVELEMLYRRGLLQGDWSMRRQDAEVQLNFMVIHTSHWDPQSERIYA